VAFLAAEVQFCATLQHKIDNGDIVNLAEAEELYSETMKLFQQVSDISRRQLQQKILSNLSNVEITTSSGNKPSLVHSRDTAKIAIDEASKMTNAGMSHEL
jgi:hypothetical protein